MGIQKIYGSRLDTFGIVIVSFLINDKDEKSRFFKKTFRLNDISIDVAFQIPVLILSNIKVNFIIQKLK